MRELYNKILNNINKIDFGSIWNGFDKYDFALYTSTEVCFKDKTIPWDEHFIGCTAIKYDDRYIAIWNVEYDNFKSYNIDIDILSSNIVHEMFHAYQYDNEEKRFPQDLVALDYPNNVYNFCLKYEENKILAKALYEDNLTIKRQLIEKFYSLRISRQQIIGDMRKCEYLLETAEGMAEYVGTMALKQLTEKKYLERVYEYSRYLNDFSPLQLNIRMISYYSGAIFLIAAHDLGINFEHSLSGQSKTIFEIITDGYKCIEIDELQLETDLIEKTINENISYKKETIHKFMQSSDRIATSGDFYICGYDPMNMRKLDNKILCKTFVMLTNQNTNENIRLMGETLLDMQKNSSNKVICYYR
jgi:hypothetical protein